MIAWEYSDHDINVGYYIINAKCFLWCFHFIRAYLGDECSEQKEFHYMPHTAIIAYFWFVWAMYRESCGANMGEALPNWHKMAIKYADYLIASFN